MYKKLNYSGKTSESQNVQFQKSSNFNKTLQAGTPRPLHYHKKNQVLNNILCKLIKNHPKEIFQVHFKLWSHKMPNEMIVMVKDQDCPDQLFSYIVLDSQGEIKELLDCHNTTSEELVLRSGYQGNIKDMPKLENQLKLAISGPGYFLEKCQDKLFLVRQGDFYVSTNNILMTTNGCNIIDQNEIDFIMSDKINSKGCSSLQCLAIIQPKEGEFKFISRNRLRFLGNIEDSKVESPTLFVNTLEEIDIYGGIMGPNFDKIKEFDLGQCP